jgi:predicted phosphoribosyltransferase
MHRSRVIELTELHDRLGVFADRAEAGEVLAGMLSALASKQPLVLGIPAGGVPVAAPVAARLDCPLDVAVISKITLPWNSESGYGAVAFDGTIRLNKELTARLPLSPQQIEAGIRATRAKVQRRVELFRGERPLPVVTGRPVILVDDGLASGYTLLTAIAALRNLGADNLVVAVPTGHDHAIALVAPVVEALYCANIRGGRSFAVAEAYRQWSDVDEEEVRRLL